MLTVNEPLLDGIDLNSPKNKIYFCRRKHLKNLMKSINSFIDFNSQTYFLTLYYMDLIFTHKDLEKIFYSHFTLWYQYPTPNDLQMSNYVLLSLSCLIIAAKFNENDPQVPSMSSFIRLLYEFSKKKYIFNLESLFMSELVVLKILKYKLNYYTIYHYLIFFFTHGIVLKKTIQRSKISKKISERKILEKIYIKIREMFDEIIESEKFYELYIGKNNYQIVVLILLWCTEYVLDEKIKDDENIFILIFGINFDPNEKKDVYIILEQLHNKIKKRNTLNKSSRLIDMNNIKKSTNDELSQNNNYCLLSSRPKRYDYNNMNGNIQSKSSVTRITTSASNYKQSYDRNPIHLQKSFNKNNEYFKYVNNTSIQNETNYNNGDRDRYNYNYSHQEPNFHNINNNNAYQLNQTTNIKYGQNKTIYLTTNKIKEYSSIYDVNSIGKNIIKNYSDGIIPTSDTKRYNSTKEVNIFPFELEKQPNDNKKQTNDKLGRVILINNFLNEPKLRKKSLSCSKNLFENGYDNSRKRPSVYIEKSINKIMNFDEKINNTKIDPPPSSKELNNYYFAIKTNEQSKEKPQLTEKPIKKKEILIRTNKSQISEYKKYLLTKNSIQRKPLNLNQINKGKTEKKIIKDNIVNRTKYFDFKNNDIKKFNITLELEPQDNYKRKSANKYYNDNGNKNYINNNINNNNKSYNNGNTIIINNNIQINTLINNKNNNLYLVNNNGFGDKLKFNIKNKKNMNMKTEAKTYRGNINRNDMFF